MVVFNYMQSQSYNYNHAKEIHKYCLKKHGREHTMVKTNPTLALAADRHEDDCQNTNVSIPVIKKASLVVDPWSSSSCMETFTPLQYSRSRSTRARSTVHIILHDN